MFVNGGVLADGQKTMRVAALPRNSSGHIGVLVEGGKGDVGSADVPHMNAVVHHKGTTSDVITGKDLTDLI